MMGMLYYFLAKLRYPELHDFISMGLGIETRSKRARQYWRKHLELSKKFQAKCLQEFSAFTPNSPPSVAILGAGRLLDIDVKNISALAGQIDLFDADPIVLRSKHFFKANPRTKLRSYVCDLTGSIASWTEQLTSFLKTNKPDQTRLKVYLEELTTNRFSLGNRYSVILSANILSQIPIYWRERACDLIYKNWGIGLDERGELPTTLEMGLTASMAKLQQDHLRLLFESDAQGVILICDERFFYYTPSQSVWQEESSLFCSWPPQAQGYSKMHSDSWLWHVVPFGSEPADCGSINLVRALSFKKL